VAAPFAATAVYYESGGGTGCASCHEIRPSYDKWSLSCASRSKLQRLPRGTHLLSTWRSTGITCAAATAASARETRRADFRSARATWRPWWARCQKCHRQEFADLAVRGARRHLLADLSGPEKERGSRSCKTTACAATDAFRRAAYAILVTPLDTTGPWRFGKARAGQPAGDSVPGLPRDATHMGAPLARPDVPAATPGP